MKLTDKEVFALSKQNIVDLTVTMGGTGSATAKVYPGYKLVVVCSAAEVDEYVNVSTPFGFKLVDMVIIHQNATACTVQAKNTAAVISDAVSIAASDTDIDKASTIDDTYYEFSTGNDDLRFAIATGAFTGIIICTIIPT